MTIHFLNGTLGKDGALQPAEGTVCEIAYSPWSELQRRSALKADLVRYFEAIFLNDKAALASFCAVVRSAMLSGILTVPLVLVKKSADIDDDGEGAYQYAYHDFLSLFLRKAFGTDSMEGSMKKNIFRRKAGMKIHDHQVHLIQRDGPPCIFFADAVPKKALTDNIKMDLFYYDEATRRLGTSVPVLHFPNQRIDASISAGAMFIINQSPCPRRLFACRTHTCDRLQALLCPRPPRWLHTPFQRLCNAHNLFGC